MYFIKLIGVVCLKYRIGMFLVVFILLIAISCFADESNVELENEFLQEINDAQTWSQITEILERYLDNIDFDLDEYNSLDHISKTEVTKALIGNQYGSINQIKTEFEHIVKKIIEDSKPHLDGGSYSSGGGGGSGGMAPPSYNTYNISGVISLPEGEVAPQGGLELTINYKEAGEPDYPIDWYIISGGFISPYPNTIIIPEGSNGIQYSFLVPIMPNYSSFVGWIELHNDENAKYQTCFYTDIIALTNIEIIANITVPYAERKIGGIFRLPDDMETLSDDLPVRIDIFNDDIGYSVYKTLNAGEREVPFLIGVKAGEYEINYNTDNSEKIGLQHVSYSGDTVYVNVSETDCTDINVVAKKQNYIEGYILLPDGETAPEGGLEISIRAASYITVNIPQGESSVYYRVGIANGRTLRCSVITKDYLGTQFVGGYYTSLGVLSKTPNERMIFEDVCENLFLDLTLIPIQSIKGILSLSEPLDYPARVSIYLRGENRSYQNNSLFIKEGELSVPYTIEIDENDGAKCYIKWRLRTGFEGDLESCGEGEVTVTGNYTRLDITDITVEKKAVLFKGYVHLPNNEVADMDTSIKIYFKSDDNRNFNKTVTILKDDSSAEYIIYGDTSNVSDNAGEYTLSIKTAYLGNGILYYDGTGFSFNEPSIITLTNETKNIDINLPEPNQIITGTITLPVATDNDIWMKIQLFNDNEWFDLDVTIPKDTTMINYKFGLLIQNKANDFNLKYIIGGNTLLYYRWIDVYLSENGFTTDYTQCTAILLEAQSGPFELDIDISDLYIRDYIKGEFVLPDGYIMPENKYFSCSIIATNGERIASGNLHISAGENRAEYKIGMPEMHNNGEWIVYYIVGNTINEPSKPVVPVPGYLPVPVISNKPIIIGTSVFHIPENLLMKYKIFITEDGLSFNEEDAKGFVFTDGVYENVNINALSNNIAAPKVIGGFFTSAVDVPDDGLNVSVILININTGEELKQDFIFKGGAQKYKFEMLGGGEYILKYIIDGSIYYYQNNYTLTPDIESASVISTMNVPAVYGKDVYYNNIYPGYYNLRYFNIRDIVAPIEIIEIKENIKLFIYDINGNLLREVSGKDMVAVDEAPVIIGYEAFV